MTVRVTFKFAFQNIVLPCKAEAEYCSVLKKVDSSDC